ncbi:MAG TPA: hypothetical protein PLP16_11785 [Smithellaceae bacterium]|nr:hypothetical protein [Smithellaceae bacterium]
MVGRKEKYKLVEQNDFFQKLIEIREKTNKTNQEGLEKIAGQLHALNGTINNCVEALADLWMNEKEKTNAIKQIAGLISDGGLAHEICGGIRHGLFGQHARSDDTLYDLVNTVNVPLSQLVNAVDTLTEIQARNNKQDAGTIK